MQDGLAHLSGHNPLVEIAGNIHGGHHQFALAYFCLEQHANLTRDKPRVNALHKRLEVGWEVGKLHHLTPIDEFPPLQIGVIVCGEQVENGMGVLHIDTSCMRWTHLEP